MKMIESVADITWPDATLLKKSMLDVTSKVTAQERTKLRNSIILFGPLILTYLQSIIRSNGADITVQFNFEGIGVQEHLAVHFS